MSGKTDWDRLRRMSEAEIEKNAREDADAPLTDRAFWKDAKMVFPTAEGKEQITLRLDKDMLRFFRSGGRGYQSRINAILRAYYEDAVQHHA